MSETEQQLDGAVEDVTAFLDAWEAEHGSGSIRGGNADVPYLFSSDLRAVLAERNALAARVAAATAELGRVNKRADFLDMALNGMRQQAVEAVKARNEATARAEKAEAERREDVAAARRERDEAKAETANLSACLMLMMARYGNQTFHEGDVKRAAELMAAMAPDASQHGLSATETAEDGVQGAGDASTPVRAAAGLSEAEGECPWCGILQKLDADGLTVEHRRFNGTKCPGATRRPNDTTEDGQHG